MEVTLPSDKLGLVLKVGLYIFLAIVGLMFFPLALQVGGVLIAAAMGTFAAAAVANAVSLRIFERGRLADIGMNWHPGAARNLALGVIGGIGAACAVLGGPLLTGMARLEKAPDQPANFSSFAFVSFILLFGAVGEEMLFRGYGFQVLLRGVGRFATILPVSVLFGLAHLNNQNDSLLGIVNTIGFAVVLGYAFVRSGDLWLPIGIHFAWNWTLPLFGVNLSGFTMGMTGVTMHWYVADIWSGGSYGPEASLLTCFAVIALLVYLSKAPVQGQEPVLASVPPEDAVR
jgi:membrane protease YdiL (CAAX protease family)